MPIISSDATGAFQQLILAEDAGHTGHDAYHYRRRFISRRCSPGRMRVAPLARNFLSAPDHRKTPAAPLPQDLASRLIASLDQHHDALARELHDVIAQSLTGVKLALFHLRSQLPGNPATDAPVSLCLETLDDSIRAVRQFAHSLHSHTVADTGLRRAVQGYLELVGRSTGLRLQYDIDPRADGIDPRLANACYRILQEAVSNCIKHAQAAHLRADLRLDTRGLQLRIEDDGRGFDAPLSPEKPGGLGLVSMRERARLSGGRLDVQSRPGQGTRLTVFWPAQTVHG